MPIRVKNMPPLRGKDKEDVVKLGGHRIPRKIFEEFKAQGLARKQGFADALATAMRTWIHLPRGYQAAALEELECDEFFEALGGVWRKVGPE